MRLIFAPLRKVVKAFQFTHPMWGATSVSSGVVVSAKVSIHAPHVGCDDVDNLLAKVQPVFQFTHPMWGATRSICLTLWCYEFQFTHPMWGATLIVFVIDFD